MIGTWVVESVPDIPDRLNKVFLARFCSKLGTQCRNTWVYTATGYNLNGRGSLLCSWRIHRAR